MLTDKYIEKLLDLYFKGELSREEKDKLFESLRSNPSLNDTVQFVLSHTDPSKAELFLSEKSLMCDTQLISEEDETLIELYLSGMMSQEEEADFMGKLVSDTDLRTNALAQAFFIKAINKIRNADKNIIDAAKDTTISDVKSLFEELKTEDDDNKIDSYFKGELSNTEIEDFNDRLKSDIEFKDRVSAIAILSKGIQTQQERDMKAIEDARQLSKEDVVSAIKDLNVEIPAAAANTGGTIVHMWAKRIAVAAVVLVIAGVGYDYYNSTVMMDYAGQSIEFASAQLPQDIYLKGNGEDLHKLFNNVQTKQNLPETIEELEEYYSADVCVDQVALALATAYVYDGQRSKAKDIIHQILNDPKSSPDVKERAKNLLDSIKKTFIF